MKKITTVLLLALSLTSARADWTDLSLSEPTVGCLAVGAANYGMNGSDTQALAIGCLVGGVAGYFLDSYYTNKVSDRYAEKINTLENQLDEIVLQQALNSSQGVEDYGIVIKKEVVPGKKLKDGSIQLPTIRLRTDLPGKDMVIGD